MFKAQKTILSVFLLQRCAMFQPSNMRMFGNLHPKQNYRMREGINSYSGNSAVQNSTRQAKATAQVIHSQSKSPFDSDSTPLLIKKYIIYKIMGSDLFIKYSMVGMNTSYKLLGVRLTNFIINKSVGSIFTSGTTVETLLDDISCLNQKYIHGVGNYVVEGLESYNYEAIKKIHEEIIESIMGLTRNGEEGNFALKLTSIISIDHMTRLSNAQYKFMTEILKFYDKDSISTQEIRQSLEQRGIEFSEEEFRSFIQTLKFKDNQTDEINEMEIYANAHLFRLDKEQRHPLFERIALNCGAGITQKDLEVFNTFSEMLNELGDLSFERNCLLYVDAEQSFMQRAIESFGQQMTHKYNQGDKHIIMNGYQCYLKRMSHLVPLEVATAKKLGYNMGLKLIRGAYMNEERLLAEKHGYESPVWDSIDDTHECYNKNISHVIKNLDQNDMLFVASHNIDSVKLAQKVARQNPLKNKDSLRFGQLKAFSDQITGDLANQGFFVYKYLPYGPTEMVMPYLVRRGQESKQVLREQTYQNDFLKGEIIKRLSPFSKN